MADGTKPTIVRRSDALHVRAVRSDTREVDFVASTDTIDSYDEVVDQASWDLRRFEKNPVILYQHDRYSLPIGQATRCEVKDGQLECTIKFATAEANPQAEQVWQLVQEKVLRAVSVGFRPMNGKYELRDGRDVYVLYDNELREISVVTVPANEDCLASMKADALEKCDDVTRDRIKSAGVERRAEIPLPAAPAATSPSTHDGPTKGDMENHMDPKELQTKLDASEKSLIDAKAAEKAAADKATAAEARTKAVETERDTAIAATATLTKEHEKACVDRDANLARATKAEGELIALEVEQLVGKKIAPTEKDDFVKLRTDSPALFASMIEKRPDMKLTERVTAPDTKANGAGAPAADAGSDIWNKL